jgi:hypothetical protein
MSPDWENRVADHAWLLDDAGLRAEAEQLGVKLTGYRELRDIMRAATPSTR